MAALYIDDAVFVFGDGGAVVVSFWRNIFPMGGAVQTSKTGLTAGEVNHARVHLTCEHLVDIHVGQTFVGGLPAVTAIVADQHAADFDAGVQARGRNGIVGEIASARLQLRAGWKICPRAVDAHAL